MKQHDLNDAMKKKLDWLGGFLDHVEVDEWCKLLHDEAASYLFARAVEQKRAFLAKGIGTTDGRWMTLPECRRIFANRVDAGGDGLKRICCLERSHHGACWGPCTS